MPNGAKNPTGGESTRPSSKEIEFRRRWYEAHHARFAADEDRYREAKSVQDGFAASAPEALELLAELRRIGNVRSFREQMEAWSKKPGTLGFKGPGGQMFVNQLVNRSEDHHELAILLADSLAPPRSDEEAVAKIHRVVDHVKRIKVGAFPAPGNVPFVLSYFWGLANHERWPVMWASAAAFLEFSTGENLPSDPAERYQEFLKRVQRTWMPVILSLRWSRVGGADRMSSVPRRSVGGSRRVRVSTPRPRRHLTVTLEINAKRAW